jgi:GntR family transcriptional regulator
VVPASLGSGDINLHRVIAVTLRSQIEEGVLRPGERLPSEEALRQQYSVSRSTVRQALDTLEREGLVSRHVGRGTFVTVPDKKPGLPARDRRDWHGTVAMAALATRRVNSGLGLPSAQVEALLGSAAPTPFAILLPEQRCGMSIKRSIRPDLADVAMEALENPDFGNGLAAALGKPVEIGRFWVEAVLAEPRFAMLLKVTPGSALLSMWWTYVCEDEVIACMQMLLAGDRHVLDVVKGYADVEV